MIKIIHEGGRDYPKIYCDACDQIIKDAQMANAIWVTEENDDKPSQVYYVHKGKCDKFMQSKYHKTAASDDLDLHLAKILLNVNLISINPEDASSPFNFEKINKALERIKRLNDIVG